MLLLITVIGWQNQKSLRGYGLNQLNVMFVWTLVMPVVKFEQHYIFLQKLPDFTVTNRFSSGFYSIKMPKLNIGKIRQFLKKNIVLFKFYYWHHKHYIELIEAITTERFFLKL